MHELDLVCEGTASRFHLVGVPRLDTIAHARAGVKVCAHSLSLSIELACRVPDGKGDPGSDGLHGGHGRVLLERRRFVYLREEEKKIG